MGHARCLHVTGVPCPVPAWCCILAPGSFGGPASKGERRIEALERQQPAEDFWSRIASVVARGSAQTLPKHVDAEVLGPTLTYI